jgi:hypothetical protein
MLDMPIEAHLMCRLCPGTRTAAALLQPALSAWASDAALTLCPGTANACSTTDVTLTTGFLPLQGYAHLIQPEWRRTQPGFAPRLYPCVLNGQHRAWVFRWSADDSTLGFVGSTPICASHRHIEMISTICLRRDLGLVDGDTFSIAFLLA